MISALATESLAAGAHARLEPGTLRLKRVEERGSAVFLVTEPIEVGEEVWLVPLDRRLVAVAGVQVSATTGGTRAG